MPRMQRGTPGFWRGDSAHRQHASAARRRRRRGWRGVAQPKRLLLGLDESGRGGSRAHRRSEYQLCAKGTANCSRGTHEELNVSRLPVVVPRPASGRYPSGGGTPPEHAGGQRFGPVTLRYDPEPPQLAFEPQQAADPTHVVVRVTDQVSGVADGVIEIGADGLRCVAHAGHAEGRRPADQPCRRRRPARRHLSAAGARARSGGQRGFDRPPGRWPADGDHAAATRAGALQAGFERTIKRKGRQRSETVLRPRPTCDSASVRVSRPPDDQRGAIQCRRDGHVLSRVGVEAEQLLETLTTDADGRFGYRVGTSSRALRLVYAGSSVTLPTESALNMRVPAATSVRVSRRRLRNGQSVTFSGRVRGLPCRPPASSSKFKSASPTAGRRSEPRGATQPEHGRAGIASSARAVSSLPLPHPAPEGGRLPLRDERVAHPGGPSERKMSSGTTRTRGDGVLANLRRHLTYANVMSTLAAFIALGGSSYAAFRSAARTSRTTVCAASRRAKPDPRCSAHQAELAGRSQHQRISSWPCPVGARYRSSRRYDGGGIPGPMPKWDLPDCGCLRRDNRARAGGLRDSDRSLRFERDACGTGQATSDPRGAARRALRSSAHFRRRADIRGVA